MKIEYTPHPAQLEIHKARDRRFRTVCCGRRFGKTRCMAAELLDRGGGDIGGDYGWVAPTYGVADRGVEAFCEIAPDFVKVVGRMPTRVEFGVNNQQIEGGTDTIASGNKTDPSLNMPMGDSALGAVGQFFAGLIGKGGTGAAAAATPAPVAAVPSAGSVLRRRHRRNRRDPGAVGEG